VCESWIGPPLRLERENISEGSGIYTMGRESYTHELSIVIVSYNTKDLLRECLHSVQLEINGLDAEVFVVDNCSRDGSPLMVEVEFPSIKLIRSPINLGFGAANNLALEVARGRYFVLLNTDAFLSVGSLRIALDHMNANPRAALAGGRLVGRDFSWQPSARMFPHVVSDVLTLTGLAAISEIKIFRIFRSDLGRPVAAVTGGLGPGRFFDYKSWGTGRRWPF
jgi:GT2 family glycosyltransferase